MFDLVLDLVRNRDRVVSKDDLIAAVSGGRRDGRLYSVRVVTAWVLQRLHRTEEARGVLAEARRIRPDLSLDEIRRFFGQRTAADLAPVWTFG